MQATEQERAVRIFTPQSKLGNSTQWNKPWRVTTITLKMICNAGKDGVRRDWSFVNKACRGVSGGDEDRVSCWTGTILPERFPFFLMAFIAKVKPLVQWIQIRRKKKKTSCFSFVNTKAFAGKFLSSPAMLKLLHESSIHPSWKKVCKPCTTCVRVVCMLDAHACACTCVYVYACAYVRVHARVYTCVRVHACVCV